MDHFLCGYNRYTPPTIKIANAPSAQVFVSSRKEVCAIASRVNFIELDWGTKHKTFAQVEKSNSYLVGLVSLGSLVLYLQVLDWLLFKGTFWKVFVMLILSFKCINLITTGNGRNDSLNGFDQRSTRYEHELTISILVISKGTFCVRSLLEYVLVVLSIKRMLYVDGGICITKKLIMMRKYWVLSQQLELLELLLQLLIML